MATLTPATWAVIAVSVASLWGVAGWALYRTLTDEDRKLDLLQRQGEIETYSSTALAELREWIEANSDDPLASDAREAHNECVETLRSIDETFYDWSDEEIDRLERL